MEKSKFSRYVIDKSKQHKSSLAIQIVYSNQVFKYVFLTNDNFQFRFITWTSCFLTRSLLWFPFNEYAVHTHTHTHFWKCSSWSPANFLLFVCLTIAIFSRSHFFLIRVGPSDFNSFHLLLRRWQRICTHTCQTHNSFVSDNILPAIHSIQINR